MDEMTLFYIKLAVTFIVSGGIIYLMNKMHEKKMEEAERQFQRTLQMIEIRNNIHPMYKNQNERK
jgi:hypothetical protein